MPGNAFTVVIACARGGESLNATLQALSALEYPLGFDTIVVDDGKWADRGRAVDMARASGLAIRQLQTPGISRGKALNLGVNESRSEFLAFLDDGCLPPPDWLSAYADAFEAWNVGVAGGPDTPPKNASFLDRSLHYVIDSFVGGLCMRMGGGLVGRYYPRPWNMAARKEAVRLAGGFNDEYPECPEARLIYRMGKIGYKSAFRPSASVRRHRETNVLLFLRRSFLLGEQRGRHDLQPELGRVYALALAAILVPLALAAIPVTRSHGVGILAAEVVAYGVALLLSAISGMFAARTPLALITVPMLTISYHIAHMAGYTTGVLGRLRSLARGKLLVGREA